MRSRPSGCRVVERRPAGIEDDLPRPWRWPAVPALPVDDPAADTVAEVRRALGTTGEGIGMADSLIAGTVLRHGGALSTRNLRRFSRVEGSTLAMPE